MRSRPTAIPRDVRRRVYHSLPTLAERLNDYEQAALIFGFRAFQPLRSFYESFARTRKDIDEYRLYLKGLAEEKLGNAHVSPDIGRPWPPDDFLSPILTRLRHSRDVRNGEDILEIRKRGESDYTGKTELCAVLAERKCQLSSPEIREAERIAVEDVKRRFGAEVEAYAGLSVEKIFEYDMLLDSEVLVRGALSRFGPAARFTGGIFQARRAGPFVICPIAQNWQLRFGIAHPGIDIAVGHLPLKLCFCDSKYRGGMTSDDESRELVMPINYQYLFPYGFLYDRFESATQLYYAIYANLKMLAVIMEDMRPLITNALEE